MKPVTGAVIGSVLVPLGLVLSLTWLPSSIADALSYGAAGPCKEPIPNGAGCWTEVTAVVTGTSVVHHSKHDDWIVNLDDDFGRQEVIVNHSSVFDDLRPLASVSARFWHGSVVLVHVPGRGDLTTEDEPGTKAGWAMLVTAFTLLGGAVFLLGALGVHRDKGSWTRSVTRDEFGTDMFDAIAPPARRWVQAIVALAFFGIFGATLAYAFFGAPIIPSALVVVGLSALAWAWSLHHRARVVLSRRASGSKSPPKSR